MSRQFRPCRRAFAALLACAVLGAATGAPAAARAQEGVVTPVNLAAGRSYPVQTPAAVTKVTVASPDVADVVVVGERDVVINGKTAGQTDVLIFGAGFRRHLRVEVGTPSDRQQIVLGVKLAEVRRDLLTQAGLSGLYRGTNVRAGSDVFRSDAPFNTTTGAITIPTEARFLTVLSDFGTRDFLALLQAETQRGRARLLAEPNLMAANNEPASFLAGGEIPIPIAQPGQGGQVFVTIAYREFGVKLNFTPEILGDSLVKLKVRPEVSSLDYGNALLLSGFRIPALRTRRIESTVDVRRSQSLVISGLFNEERQQVRTGIPLLMDIPILGHLFSSTQWQRNETELVVIVTPVVVNPRRPRAQDLPPIVPDTTLPARGALERRLPSTPRTP